MLGNVVSPSTFTGWDRVAIFGVMVGIFFIVVYVIPWATKEEGKGNEDD